MNHTAEDLSLRTKPISQAITRHTHTHGASVIEYQPGNGTRYVLLISRIDAAVAEALGYGNLNARVITLATAPPFVSMVIGGHEGFVHWTHVVQKLGLRSATDAKVLAELIADRTGLRAVTTEELVAEANGVRHE